MSLLSGVDVFGKDWVAVCAFIDARIAGLTEVCVATATPDKERQDCASRIDELRRLRDEPERIAEDAKRALAHKAMDGVSY